MIQFLRFVTRLQNLFRRLRAANLKSKPNNCKFFTQCVKYFSHVVSNQAVKEDKDKVAAIRDWPAPKCKLNLQAFLGTCGYCRRFISCDSKISRLLTQAAAWDLAFHCNEECQETFVALKKSLMNTPLLSYSTYELPLILDTYASRVGTIAVLAQLQDG